VVLAFDLFGHILGETQPGEDVAVAVAERCRPDAPVSATERRFRAAGFAVLDGRPEQRLEVCDRLLGEHIGNSAPLESVCGREHLAEHGTLGQGILEIAVVDADGTVREVLGQRPVAALGLLELSFARTLFGNVAEVDGEAGRRRIGANLEPRVERVGVVLLERDGLLFGHRPFVFRFERPFAGFGERRPDFRADQLTPRG